MSQSVHASFVPLRRTFGLSVLELLRLRSPRQIVIWGAGTLGRCLLRQFKRASPETPVCFVDQSEKLRGCVRDGGVVFGLDDLSQLFSKEPSSYVIVAAGSHYPLVRSELERLGRAEGKDFCNFQKISRPEAIIEIAARSAVEKGATNQYLPVKTFSQIVNNFAREMRDIFAIDLTGWGRPIIHPDIAEIVRISEAVAPTKLSVSINEPIELIRSGFLTGLTQFTVTVEDELTDDNIVLLECLADASRGVPTELRVLFTEFQDNIKSLPLITEQCATLGLRLVRDLGYPSSYDRFLDALESGRDFGNQFNRLPWPVSNALIAARSERERECLCQRIFPVVHSDASVSVCHLYSERRLSARADMDSIEQLFEKRSTADLCRSCQNFGLHRLDIDVLRRRNKI